MVFKVVYKPRTAWTKEKAGGKTLTGKKLIGLAVHYPASGNEDFAKLTDQRIASLLNGWRNYHMIERDWADIGYQVAIDGHGQVWDLRGITRIPAAHASPQNPDANEEWGAVLFIIGDHEIPTPEAIAAFNDFYRNHWLKKWPTADEIRGHGDVPYAQTKCPGNWLRNAIRSGEIPQKLPAGNLENGDEDVKPTTVIGVDSDKTALTMGELARRLDYFVGGAAAKAPIYNVLARIEGAVKNIDERLLQLEQKDSSKK